MAASDSIYQHELNKVDESAPLHDLLQSHIIRLLVLGGPLVGKTTLISTCLNADLSAVESKQVFTVGFKTNKSTVTEFKGLHYENKNRGQVWRSVVEFISQNSVDIVWFCTNTDFLDNNDELWHWVASLRRVSHVVITRTKCLSPSEELRNDTTRKLGNDPPPVVCVLAKDTQLNPKGGGAVVEAYGVDDLIAETTEQLNAKNVVARGAVSKLLKDVKSDEERYAAEEQQKSLMVNALRSLSSTEGSENTKDSLGEDEFVVVPRPESPSTGFVHMINSKPARTVVGALVAFAVIGVIYNKR